MSTPIENNTEELQDILQTVNNLPNLGGSGGSEYDLELIANMPEDIGYVEDLSAEHITVNGNYETLKAKIMSGKGIKAVLRHSYEHQGYVYHNTVPAFSAGFHNVIGGDCVFAEFLISLFPGYCAGTIFIFRVLLGVDNSIQTKIEYLVAEEVASE